MAPNGKDYTYVVLRYVDLCIGVCTTWHRTPVNWGRTPESGRLWGAKTQLRLSETYGVLGTCVTLGHHSMQIEQDHLEVFAI
jgi:hypothetical protein